MTTHAPENSRTEVPPVAPRAKVFKFGFLALAVLMLVCWFRFYYLPERQQESDAAVAAAAIRAKQAADYAATHPQTTQPQQQLPARTVEALILQSECDFKIRTERHPLWIRFHNADWVYFPGETDRPGEGDFKPTAPVQPGDADFKSADGDGSIHVQVYKRVLVAAPQ